MANFMKNKGAGAKEAKGKSAYNFGKRRNPGNENLNAENGKNKKLF